MISRDFLVRQDRLNRQLKFDLEKQHYPADLFILKGFNSNGPIWERNPKWHDENGFFIGRRYRCLR